MKTFKPTLSAIAAMSLNRVIGNNNKLPWHMPADLKHFKALTTGHTIIMGRKTYDSIGKPLPNRTNIILTRDTSFTAQGSIVYYSITELLGFIHQETSLPTEIFIIGGATLYSQLLMYVNRLYLTILHHDFAGDTYFPEIDKKNWDELECITHPADNDNPYPYRFIVLERKSPSIHREY